MFRTFTITLPDDDNNHNLFSLIVGTSIYGLVNGGTNESGITGAIPTDGIFPDRVAHLDLTALAANEGNVTLSDRNYANTYGKVLASGDTFEVNRPTNSICLKDYFLIGSEASQGFTVTIEST